MRALGLLLLLVGVASAVPGRDPQKCARVVMARTETLAAVGGGIFRMPKRCQRIALIPGLSMREENGRTILSANGIDVVLTARGYPGQIPADSRYDARLMLREETK